MLAPYSDDPLVSLRIQINNSTWIILTDVKSGKWSWSRFIFSNSSRVLISCSGEKNKGNLENIYSIRAFITDERISNN